MKAFSRFAKDEDLDDQALLDAIQDAESGKGTVDLGGDVYKVRVAREGEGKSGGYRTLVAMRSGTRAIFTDGFAKNELDNIGQGYKAHLKKQAAIFLGLDDSAVDMLIVAGKWREIVRQEEKREERENGNGEADEEGP